ncbi:MAG: hypothetical protein LUE10_00100 [Alistipes sp.]|nr:hypothetical protein [Alistipes sp.]
MALRGVHIANAKRRDAEVAFDAQTERPQVRTVLKDGGEKRNVRVLKSTLDLDEDALARQFGSWDEVAEALVEDDPEIDVEIIGRKLTRTHRLWIDKDNRIAYSVNLFRTVFNPDGSERERRDINKLPSNVNKEFPLKWTGRLFPRGEVIRRFVFTRSYQIRHINGATFDFLYNMAGELQKKDSLVMLGGGEKGTDPILLSRGGQPYRAFLEGRVEADRYILIMHLSDIELKTPEDEGR